MARSNPSFPGTIGRYEVVKRLGQGAMGQVVLAKDPVLDRLVAIKLLRDDLGLPEEHQQQLFERMRQEARASARVSHPNIVALFDMGEDPVAGLFLVFEYVRGSTLKDHIGAQPLAPARLAVLSRELGSALATAHEAQVLHRDIKPENVILSPTGSKIADFGIARLPESTLTRDGKLLGTPAYSAPESISYGHFSPASDQFSLAATLYEALSQNRAFPGDDAIAVATLITTEPPTPIAASLALAPAVDAVLFRALAKDPKARFSSCDEFGTALADAILLTPEGRTRPTAPTMPRVLSARDREIGSKTLRIIAGAATLGAIAMAAVLHLTRSCQGTEELRSSSPDASQTTAQTTRTDERRKRELPMKPPFTKSRALSIPATTKPLNR